MPELPHGTVAFLFTDIAGSTRLWQSHRAAMERAYARHDALLRDALAAHRGIVYKVIGDAVQAAFPTVPEAVVAALEAQLGLFAEDWGALGLPEPVRIRMALHVGAVEPDLDGDYRSPVLNRVGRLLGAGHGGQVLLSAGAAFLGRDRLPAGGGLRDLGAHRLKDLLEPEPIYQLLHSELPDAFPPLATLDRLSHNLPLQPNPFLGRQREVAQVVELLERPDVRLLTLTGPGGTGKTRLGLQVAAEVVEDFPDGVFFVDLSPLTDPALVPSAIAEALSVREDGGRSLLERLREYLASKQLLLVLDNVEQVSEAAPVVGELLRTSPGLKVLTTTRVPLRLRAEQEYAVPPLGLPRRKPPPTLEQLTQYEAVRLFIARAQAVKSTFAIDNETAPAIAEICHRLDGLPLAIELAAARVRMLPPQSLLARLEQRLPLLTGGARDLPARQQTLRNTIAWSYDLLTSEEQTLFWRLAVFNGGASWEAIEAVANPGGELDPFTGLERLVEQSLVRQEDDSQGEPRFRMLETIREFGLERLDASGQAEEFRRRHAGCFVELVERAEPELRGPEQGRWLDRLEGEHPNLRAALAWMLEHDPAGALRLAGTIWRFWLMRGHLTEGRTWLERVCAATSGDRTVWRARSLHAAAKLACMQTDYVPARALGEEGLALARELGDPTSIAWCIGILGDVAGDQGDHQRGTVFLEEALALMRETGNQHGMAAMANNLAEELRHRGEYERAEALYEDSLALNRGQGDKRGEALVLNNLGLLAAARGDDRAARLYADALTLYHETGNRFGIMETLGALARLAGGTGHMERSAHLFGAEAPLRAEIGAPLPPVERAAHERVVAAVRDYLGVEAFATAWAAGERQPLDEVIAEAVATVDKVAGAAVRPEVGGR